MQLFLRGFCQMTLPAEQICSIYNWEMTYLCYNLPQTISERYFSAFNFKLTTYASSIKYNASFFLLISFFIIYWNILKIFNIWRALFFYPLFRTDFIQRRSLICFPHIKYFVLMLCCVTCVEFILRRWTYYKKYIFALFRPTD